MSQKQKSKSMHQYSERPVQRKCRNSRRRAFFFFFFWCMKEESNMWPIARICLRNTTNKWEKGIERKTSQTWLPKGFQNWKRLFLCLWRHLHTKGCKFRVRSFFLFLVFTFRSSLLFSFFSHLLPSSFLFYFPPLFYFTSTRLQLWNDFSVFSRRFFAIDSLLNPSTNALNFLVGFSLSFDLLHSESWKI